MITGASAGIGRATVREFAHRGASIGLLARGLDGLNAAASEVHALGGRALVLPCDVAHSPKVEDAAARLEQEFGPIDIWINNAMVSVFSPVKDMTADEYRRVTEVTYLGSVHGTLAALRRMLPRNRGTIVQVGSALAYRAIPLQSAYSAAKHALRGFTDSLRTELLHDGSKIRLTMVHLPAHNTPQFTWVKSRLPNQAQPVPPIYQPEVAARAIYWAAHHHRRELWVEWPTIRAIVGNKLAPGYADRYLARSGYESQQTAEPRDIYQPDNLWEPVAGDHGAHGAFDHRASYRAPFLWASLHRSLLGAVTAAGIATGVLLAAAQPGVSPPRRLNRAA